MRARSRFFKRWQNYLGIFLVASFILVALAAPLLSPNDPENPGPVKIVGNTRKLVPQPPSDLAPLGTLPNQASVFHALVWGTRSALGFGILVTLCAALIGTLIGAVGAYFGGWLDHFLMWLSDTFLTFPVIAAIVVIQQLVTIFLHNLGIYFDYWGVPMVWHNGSISAVTPPIAAMIDRLQSIDPVLIAFILFSWMYYARVMNASMRRVKQMDYVLAARASGVPARRIIFRYMLPNAITPVIVLASRDIGAIVVLQTTFSFIGIGKTSPWSMVLTLGKDWMFAPKGLTTYWWVFFPVTLALVLFGIAWNLVGDSLNEALNPRSPAG